MAKRTGRKKKQAAVSLPMIGGLEPPKGSVTVDVDNPHYSRSHEESGTNPKATKAWFNPRESYCGFLWSKQLITAGEWKVAGIVRFHFERLGGAGAGAMDYTKEPVDGGKNAQDITDPQLLSGEVMKEMARVLGPQGHDLVLRMAGNGEWPKDIAPRDKRKQDYLSMRLRECLEHLAVHWKFQRREERRSA